MKKINLVIYGDDPLTPLVDEGMSGSEDFYLKLWDASFNDIFIYQSDTNVVSFNGWMNTNAAPLPNYNDPNVIYNFIISLGCTDSMAFNYDSLAIVDDGSCVAILGGCTDSTAFNYDLNANTDDGSCMPYIFGCTDPLAFNYDVNANTDDGNCCLINQLIQKGSDINGEGFEDYSGHSVSLSANGKTVAIGALYNNGNGTNSGHVRIYNYNDTSWVQLGQDIDGVASYDYSGSSVSLSSDGGTVAIGAYGNDGNGSLSGSVRVYSFDGTAWNQLGNDVYGEAIGDNSGYSISLSSNGQILAIGAILNDGSSISSGHTRIYSYNGTSWTQLGQDIDGEGPNDDHSGHGVLDFLSTPKNNHVHILTQENFTDKLIQLPQARWR